MTKQTGRGGLGGMLFRSPVGEVACRIWSGLKRAPVVREAVQSDTWGRIRHRVALYTDVRHAFTFTHFLRLPRQYDALSGPVVDALAPLARDGELTIIVIGCSIGAEPYSIASVLRTRRPDLRFTVRAFDISDEMLERGRRGEYATDEIFCNPLLPAEFITDTFERHGTTFRVRSEISSWVSFGRADVLDKTLAERAGTADVLYVQNLLFNLPRPLAAQAFTNSVALLRPRSAMFVDGMDLDMRETLTRRAGLAPLDNLIPEIHEDARAVRAAGWPYHYWGLEPFSAARRNWRRRFATIFTHGLETASHRRD